MVPDFEWVRGATFLADLEFDFAIDGVAITSSVQTKVGDSLLTFPLDVTVIDLALRRGQLRAETGGWPSGVYAWDIKLVGAGVAAFSDRKTFALREGVTP